MADYACANPPYRAASPAAALRVQRAQAPIALPSPTGLTWAHISGEVITVNDGVEALESISHGYRSGRSIARVSGPASETSNGPARPGETIRSIRILLFGRAAL